MPNHKIALILLLATTFLSALALPVLAVTYNPGVSVGQFVEYGNFVGNGQGFESFNDYKTLKLTVTNVTNKEVTLLSTGEFKNGTALPGNGTSSVWNIETGTQDGNPSTQGPIIAANLNKGDPIPPPNTYQINATQDRTYLGETRTVNILDVTISTPDYNSTLTYIYDKNTGLLLESTTQTTIQSDPQPVTSSSSYRIVDTNSFSQPAASPLPLTYIILPIIVAVLVVLAIIILLRRKQ